LAGAPVKKHWLPASIGWSDLGRRKPTVHYMKVSINGDTPIAGWFIMENPIEMDDFNKKQVGLIAPGLWQVIGTPKKIGKSIPTKSWQ